MAEEGTFCINADVVKKAGVGASATSTAEAYTNNFIKQAEGRIMIIARNDLKSNYGTLNSETKELLREAASNLAAIYAILYDMSGYNNRIEAEDIINVLEHSFRENMELLKDQKVITYSGASNTVSGGITVREVDSTPTVSTVKTIVFPNDTVTDDGSGQITYTPAAAGSGDVTGPDSSTDNAIARFDSTTGKIIQNSAVTIADTTGNVAGLGTLTAGANTLTIDETASLTDYIQDIIDDATPQLGGDLDAQDKKITGAASIGFTQELDNGSKTESFSVDFSTDQKQKATLTANTITLTLDTTDVKVGNYLLKLINGGLATLTWASESGSLYWPGGTEPSLTSSGTDLIALYFDGTNWYGVESLDFS